jgi:hypothetical protein
VIFVFAGWSDSQLPARLLLRGECLPISEQALSRFTLTGIGRIRSVFDTLVLRDIHAACRSHVHR